jgi:DNA-binding IclR family transcriptional regulator
MSETAGTVARVVRLLHALAETKGDVSIKDLSARLALPPSSVHRLLGLLMEDGMVERGEGGHLYRAGLEFFRIGSLVATKTSIADIARPFMRTVVDECDEICMLVLYMPGLRRVMTTAFVDSSKPLRYQVELFRPHTMLWGATGRSVLAFLDQPTIAAAIAEGDPSPATGQALPPPDKLLRDLADIRATGYALTSGQKIEGAIGLGTPLFDAAGKLLGSLCITVPRLRFRAADETALAGLLMKQAQALNKTLGHAG